ncbi:unnamed protein product [Paramecium pentaurelia]|uniref:Uncharacterized protein n=1 Tax=Paramecium pentaurelia TaxID=43138 RepID=A0A8S1WPB2_9CILI|nr:unnamed protein product [Paramecium pentaurelia]
MDQYIPLDLFQTQLKQKASQYKLDDDQKQVKQHREFKILLANTQIQLKTQFSELNQSIQSINNTLKKKAQVYLNLINLQFPLSESSYSDLDIMVNILQGDVLDQWQLQKEHYFNYIDKLKSSLKFEIDKFTSLIDQKASEIMQEEKMYKLEGLKKQGQILKKTNFDIHYTQQRETKYIYQGEILYSFQQYYLLSKPQINTNLEQIKHLQWIGEKGKNERKNGLWSMKWKGENCNGCGGEYSLDGMKRGKWKEIIKNYYDNAKVYEVGEYINDIKSRTWKYIYNDQEIGGGEYNQLGQKDGKWIELSEGFSNKSQVIYNGQYKNNKKVGQWISVAWGQQVGCGSYDEKGNELKIGWWVELNHRFSDYSQVFYIGEYKNGYQVENKEIGGGSYDQGNNGIKIGKWIKLSDEFSHLSQVTYHGEYKYGKKIDRWNTIGGGSFDEQGYGIKVGNLNGQVTYIGEYKNGKKVGRWNITFNGQQIGGGSYDEVCDEMKIGRWIELSDGFWDQSQVVYEVNIRKIKVGKWDIIYYKDRVKQQIGYGSYDDDGLKIGKWVELNDQFQNCSQILYIGHFKKGRKIGRWDIADEGQLIGSGTYDEQNENMKIGQWVELYDGLQNSLQVFYKGEYKNGCKVGKWDISIWGKNIGGGAYDEQSNSMKIGEWIEQMTGFHYYNKSFIRENIRIVQKLVGGTQCIKQYLLMNLKKFVVDHMIKTKMVLRQGSGLN